MNVGDERVELRSLVAAVSRTRRALAASTALFLIGCAVGSYVTGDLIAGATSSPLLDQQYDPGIDFTFVSIYLNNLFVVLTVGLGGFLIGLPTVGMLLLNGMLVGISLRVALIEYADPVVALTLFAHGLVEVPALLLAGAAALRVPVAFTRYLSGRSELLTENELRDFGIVMAVAIVCVTVAAAFEVYVTPVLFDLVS